MTGFDSGYFRLLDYGERRMRSALSALPDGSYEFEDVMEWAIEMSRSGSSHGRRASLPADFTGTPQQIEANFNAVEAVTRSCLYYAVRVATDPTIPANGGCYRPISLRVPLGSIVGAKAPAAVAAGNVETANASPTSCLAHSPRRHPIECMPPHREP